MPASLTSAIVSPGGESRKNFRHALCLVVRVQRQQGPRDPERLQQRAGVARVLRRDGGGALERLARARADITHVANRRRYDLQPAWWLAHYNPRLRRTIAAVSLAPEQRLLNHACAMDRQLGCARRSHFSPRGLCQRSAGPRAFRRAGRGTGPPGNQTGAAQMYQALANRAAAHNATILHCKRRQPISRRGVPTMPHSALDLLSPPLSADETFDRSLIQVQVALQRGQAAQAWQLIGAIAMPQQSDAGDAVSAPAAASRFRLGATGRGRRGGSAARALAAQCRRDPAEPGSAPQSAA